MAVTLLQLVPTLPTHYAINALHVIAWNMKQSHVLSITIDCVIHVKCVHFLNMMLLVKQSVEKILIITHGIKATAV